MAIRFGRRPFQAGRLEEEVSKQDSKMIGKHIRTDSYNHGRCGPALQIEPNLRISRSNDLETRGDDTHEELSDQDKSE